ncbi:MAG: phosphoribosylformylglycinamidine synthase subunit PurQ [Candidatus Methanolliviera hydrocarbonicum]|uniref:Phosphoribosylformylglycinamidine synthase subunit PurQ n=1 Tax=Candidatus Methanolliviera hydrocarbonicum TaxID=2491085 RepID=A0A520KXQ1_9EURY|nr:MAG: phosphoribosylformylglycinamidine synthase subunit PurQ [Candidatus Methanolliviera hydrocarbonicum]
MAKICVLRMEGTNCEWETFLAFKRLKGDAEFVHIKQILKESEEERFLEDYACVIIPGGFSSGDYVRAGAIFASRLSKLKKEIIEFIEEDKLLGGICNGFQVLVELGVLPGIGEALSEEKKAVLTVNDSNLFECRPTLLRHVNGGKCIFTRRYTKDKIVIFPSAHAEGKLVFGGEDTLEKMIENDQIVFRYTDSKGDYAGYPWNPNGSTYNIAGICNERGNVFGLMPHPERVFYSYTHPDWTRNSMGVYGDGMPLFKSILDYIDG